MPNNISVEISILLSYNDNYRNTLHNQYKTTNANNSGKNLRYNSGKITKNKNPVTYKYYEMLDIYELLCISCYKSSYESQIKKGMHLNRALTSITALDF